ELTYFRFLVPMRDKKVVQALHEPEDARLDSEDLTCFRFMGTERGSETRETTHEPERRAPARRGVACPECADLEIGAPSPPFMVPMRARKNVEAFPEARSCAGVSRRNERRHL